MVEGTSDTSISPIPEEPVEWGTGDRAEGVAHGIYDTESGRSDWSDDACRILGLPADRLPRTRDACIALIHPDDRARVVARVSADIAARRPSELECRIVAGEGDMRVIRCRVDAQHDPETLRVQRVFWSVWDVTAHAHLDSVMQHSDALLTLVVESCREILFVRDAGTDEVVYCSPAWGSVAGVPVDRWPKTRVDFLTLVHPDDREHMRTTYREAFVGPVTQEWRLMRPGGGVRWMVSRLVPLRDGNEVTHIAGLTEDVTDRRDAQLAERRLHDKLSLVAGRSAMWETATAIAHEIQQPLFAIFTYARSCLRRLDRGDATMKEIRDVYHRIAAEAERSSQMIRRLGDLGRGRPPATAPDDLNGVVDEVVRLSSPETLPSDVAVDLTLDPSAPVAQVDRVQVQQVLLNLIRNAVEAMADSRGSRRLSICVTSNNAEAFVSVGDTGPGIDPPDMIGIFEPFYTTKPEGTGMGLPICRTIVEAHGGRLRAAAREGGGAVFTFTLPLATRAGARDG